MKAIVLTTYGSPEVLQLQEIDQPVPQPHEILVKVHAAAVNFDDLLGLNFSAARAQKFNLPWFFWLLTKISSEANSSLIRALGNELAGEVVAVGAEVTRFHPGDQVFAYTGLNFGAYTEYCCLPAEGVVARKPHNLTMVGAAGLPYNTMMALGLLRQIPLQPGQKILISGAARGIGAAAVQIAKHHFQMEVTGVCSPARQVFVQALGADYVIYPSEDFTQNEETYDLILDLENKVSFVACQRSLSPGGFLFSLVFEKKKLGELTLTARSPGIKFICTIAPESQTDLETVRELIEAGKIKAQVDRVFPLAQTAAAYRYVEEGQKKGQVVIKIL